MAELPAASTTRAVKRIRSGLLAGIALGLLGWIGGQVSEPRTRSGAMFLTGVLLGVATTAYALLVAKRNQGSTFSVLHAAIEPILMSERTTTWFGVGALIGAPILRFHGTVLGDADSARILANVSYIRAHGVGYLAETQEVLIPHGLYWVTSALGGISLARWVPVLTYVLLSGTVAAIAFRAARHPIAPVVAAVGLLGFVPLLDQQKRLPLYALMLAASTAGAFLSVRVADAPDRRTRWRWAALAALLLAIGAESHATGQLFLTAPAILLALPPWPARWRATLTTYVSLGLIMVPRLAINLSEHGTSRLRSNYDYYLIRNGYLDLINRDFWGYPVNVPLRDYVSDFSHMLRVEFGFYALAVMALGTIGFVLARTRVKVAAVVATIVVVGGILQLRPSPFPRYILPLAPALVILAAWGAAQLARREGVGVRIATVGLIALVAISGAWSLIHAQHGVQFNDERIRGGAWPAIAAAIDDDRAVAGVRSPQIMYVRDDLEVFGPLIWTEAEYVTYLTWPSDEKVLGLLKKYDIGWVFLTGDGQRRDGTFYSYETDYPGAWVVPTYAKSPRQPEMIAKSPNFCLTTKVDNFRLYKVGACPGA